MSKLRCKPRAHYCGVYGIRHRASGMMYIGGSTDITGRYTHHRFVLRRGIHKTVALQALWNAQGEAAFEFVTLERCTPDVLLDIENVWIKSYAACLNTVLDARPGTGSQPSDKKKAAARKRWANPDYRAKRQAWLDDREAGRFRSRSI